MVCMLYTGELCVLSVDPSRGLRHQRRVETLTNDSTVVPDLPVEWNGEQCIVMTDTILVVIILLINLSSCIYRKG